MAGKPNNRKHKVTHLVYMDDLKIYAKNQHDLQKMLNVTQEYIHNTGMTFNANKCATYHLERGRSVMEGESVSLLDGSTIQHLQRNNSYTYLGIKQREIHDITTVKATLVERYKKTLRTIWLSELTAKHKSTATNMLAVPIVSHTFASRPIHPQTGIINWPNNSASEDGDVTDKKRYWGAAPVALLRSCVGTWLGRSQHEDPGTSYILHIDQTVVNKGSAELVSFLNHFIEKGLPKEVKVFEVFCDSCAGEVSDIGEVSEGDIESKDDTKSEVDVSEDAGSDDEVAIVKN
ncbi:hypothetical protein Trydic_g1276 [Trypoxylus dichotomus]